MLQIGLVALVLRSTWKCILVQLPNMEESGCPSRVAQIGYWLPWYSCQIWSVLPWYSCPSSWYGCPAPPVATVYRGHPLVGAVRTLVVLFHQTVSLFFKPFHQSVSLFYQPFHYFTNLFHCLSIHFTIFKQFHYLSSIQHNPH